jgi:hypothetical protein
MSTYLIFTRERTLGAKELGIYWEMIRATFTGHEVKVLASYGQHEDLEGPPTEGTVIAELPSTSRYEGLVRQSFVPRSASASD